MRTNPNRNSRASIAAVSSGAVPRGGEPTRKAVRTKHDAYELLGRRFLIQFPDRTITVTVTVITGPRPDDTVQFLASDGSSYIRMTVAQVMIGWQSGFLQEV